LPPASPIVQALLFAEMTTGLLMGAQDLSAIRGELVCDRAAAGEKFRGMRETVECREGEIILRDDEGIIATLFQGPDHRTRLKKNTKSVVFFVFSTPGLTMSDVQQGMEVVGGIFNAAGSHCDMQIHGPAISALSVG
jgi:DNA/RNA-binding domain of Phe-tRNA-synthetase-like protein